MEESKACLYHYLLDGTGTGIAVSPATEPGENHILWMHLNARHSDTRKILKEQLHLDPLIIRALLAEETRPRLEEIGENALIILRGIHHHPGDKPEDLVSIRLWVSKNRIVTVSRRKAQAILDLHERIHHKRGPTKVGEFVAMLCSHLHDGIEPAIRELEATTDTLEEESLDHPDHEDLRGNIANARKQAILFRRHMAPQRDVVYRLQNSKQMWMSNTDKWYMQDNLDRVTRYLEDLDAIRERAQIVQDELSSALTSRLNKNIYLLSMITVVFMPLTFLTGLLGINVEGIPGANNINAFAIFCTILVALGALELWLFKRLKWI